MCIIWRTNDYGNNGRNHLQCVKKVMPISITLSIRTLLTVMRERWTRAAHRSVLTPACQITSPDHDRSRRISMPSNNSNGDNVKMTQITPWSAYHATSSAHRPASVAAFWGTFACDNLHFHTAQSDALPKSFSVLTFYESSCWTSSAGQLQAEQCPSWMRLKRFEPEQFRFLSFLYYNGKPGTQWYVDGKCVLPKLLPYTVVSLTNAIFLKLSTLTNTLSDWVWVVNVKAQNWIVNRRTH